ESEEYESSFQYYGKFYSDDLHLDQDESYLNKLSQDKSNPDKSYKDQDESCQDELQQDKSCPIGLASQAGPTGNETSLNDR
ncbi:9003_t:CDS:1, partial [Racocetra persica]